MYRLHTSISTPRQRQSPPRLPNESHTADSRRRRRSSSRNRDNGGRTDSQSPKTGRRSAGLADHDPGASDLLVAASKSGNTAAAVLVVAAAEDDSDTGTVIVSHMDESEPNSNLKGVFAKNQPHLDVSCTTEYTETEDELQLMLGLSNNSLEDSLEIPSDSLRSLMSKEDPLGGEVVKKQDKPPATSRTSPQSVMMIPPDQHDHLANSTSSMSMSYNYYVQDKLQASYNSYNSLTEAETEQENTSTSSGAEEPQVIMPDEEECPDLTAMQQDNDDDDDDDLPPLVDHEEEEEPDLETVLETLNEQAADAATITTSSTAQAIIVAPSSSTKKPAPPPPATAASKLPSRSSIKKKSFLLATASSTNNIKNKRERRVKSADATTLRQRMKLTQALTSDDEEQPEPMKDTSNHSSTSSRHRSSTSASSSSKKNSASKRKKRTVSRSKTTDAATTTTTTATGTAASSSALSNMKRNLSSNSKGTSTPVVNKQQKSSPTTTTNKRHSRSTRLSSSSSYSSSKNKNNNTNNKGESQSRPIYRNRTGDAVLDRMSQMMKRVSSGGSPRTRQRSSVTLPVTPTGSTLLGGGGGGAGGGGGGGGSSLRRARTAEVKTTVSTLVAGGGAEGSSLRRNHTTSEVKLVSDNARSDTSPASGATAGGGGSSSLRRARTAEVKLVSDKGGGSSLRRNHTASEVKLVSDNARSDSPATSGATAGATTPAGGRSLRKNRTVDERSTPKRTFSSGKALGGISAALPLRLPSSSGGPKRSTSKGTTKRTSSKGATTTTSKRNSASSGKPTTHLNIFGSDIVSQEYILSQLDQVEQDTNIVKLELEDFLVAQRESLDIPQKLKSILGSANDGLDASIGGSDRHHGMRPWEGIHFVDELLDGFTYRAFKKSRKRFVRGMDGICAQHLIACSYKTKINITVDNAHEEPSRLLHLIKLVEDFQKDTSVVRLSISTNQTTPELIRALIALLLCDGRAWEGVRLRLGGIPTNFAPKAIKSLQRAARAKDIDLDLVLT